MNNKRWWLLFALAIALTGLNYANGQATVVLAPIPQFTSYLASGSPNAFGCVFTYSSNTTTPLATYTDSTGTTLNANPVILNSGGNANIWLAAVQAYSIKVVAYSGNLNGWGGSPVY